MKIKMFKNLLYMLRYAFKYVPGYCFLRYFMQFLFGLYDIWWGIYLMKTIIDGIEKQLPSWLIILFVGAYFIYGSIIQCFAAYVYEVCEPSAQQKINDRIQPELFKKTIALDLACYDDPEFFNDFIMAMENTDKNIMESIHITADIFKNIIAFSGLGITIIMWDAIGIVFVAVSIIGTLVINSIVNKINLQRDIEIIPHNRKRDYTKRVFYLADYAKEIRLNNIKEKLIDNFIRANREGMTVIKKYKNKFFILNFLKSFIFGDLLINFIYMFVLAYKAIVLKTISYGIVAGMTGGLWNFRQKIKEMIDQFAELHKNSLYAERYKIFMEYESKICDSENSIDVQNKVSIKLDNVSFSYSNCNNATLKNIDLEFKPGEKIAIVGYNGAGKSTLIKLIMRLYDVSDGKIMLNDKNIKEYKVKDYRELYGTVFQDYQLFAAKVSENVIMDIVYQSDMSVINKALTDSGFDVKLNSLANGIETQLTREFKEEGIILSGGEAQKLAIARVFAKKCEIIILDEPSSSLDPISEYHLNKSMMSAAKDKTVIFISHRLSTTRIADRIYMLDSGRIIEHGSHDELMSQNGKYAEMFNLQAEKYRIHKG